MSREIFINYYLTDQNLAEQYINEIGFRIPEMKQELLTWMSDDDVQSLTFKAMMLGIVDELKYWKNIVIEADLNYINKDEVNKLSDKARSLGLPDILVKCGGIMGAFYALGGELERRRESHKILL